MKVHIHICYNHTHTHTHAHLCKLTFRIQSASASLSRSSQTISQNETQPLLLIKYKRSSSRSNGSPLRIVASSSVLVGVVVVVHVQFVDTGRQGFLQCTRFGVAASLTTRSIICSRCCADVQRTVRSEQLHALVPGLAIFHWLRIKHGRKCNAAKRSEMQQRLRQSPSGVLRKSIRLEYMLRCYVVWSP